MEGVLALETYNYYTDIVPIYALPTIKQESIVASSEGVEQIEQYWNEFMNDNTIRRYKYTDRENGKKYEHRFGYSMTILIPKGVDVGSYGTIAKNVMKELLVGHKQVSWIAEATTQGKGSYLTFTICLAKKYKKDKTVRVFYSNDVYKHSEKKCFTKASDPNAILVYKKGDVKEEVQTTWSKKIRLFEMEKSEFINNFIPMLKRIVTRSINLVKKIKAGNYLKYIKHVTLEDKRKTIYYNINVRYYNDFIAEANMKLRYWENAIYSDSKYYQDEATLTSWNAFKQKFLGYTHKRTFKYKSSSNNYIKISLNPWINTTTFKENIVTLFDVFEMKLDWFLTKHIYIMKG